MIIVDSHCHLDDERFADRTIDEIIAEADKAGVKYMQTIGTTIQDFEIIHPIALKYKNIFCSFGIHPHHADTDVVTYDEIIAKGKLDKVIAIGETGLDYFYENAPKQAQIESFKNHLRAARELELPVIIHTRDAEEDTIKILDEILAEEGSEKLKLVFHCFSSSKNLAEYAIKNGIYMSASGIITFKKAEEVRDSFIKVPDELLLVETDAPYLAPIPHRGKDNQPAYTKIVAEKLAEIRGQSLSDVAEITTNNFFNLFTKAKRS